MTEDDSNLHFVALNSSHVFYTKLMFVKSDEGMVALALDLYTLVNAFESPPVNEHGKTQLIVDDAQWTRNSQFVVLVLAGARTTGLMSNATSAKTNNQCPATICILPRLGVALTQVINPTLVNLPQTLGADQAELRKPCGFISLYCNDSVIKTVQK